MEPTNPTTTTPAPPEAAAPPSSAELRAEVEHLRQLQRAGAVLATRLGLQPLMQALIELATELAGARSGALLYRPHGHDHDGFALRAVAGEAWDAFANLVSGDANAAPPVASDAVASQLTVPLRSRTGNEIGRIVLGHAAQGAFSERHRRLIVELAAQGAGAIDNARLYEETRRALEERSRALDAERATRLELERAVATKDRALATRAHDLRAPLNAILGWAEILLIRLGPDSEHRAGLEVISRNARVQAAQIDAMLGLDRELAAGRVAKSTELAAVAPGRPAAAASLAGLRVLVIDDDADARELVRTILVDARADAITAASADEGLTLLRQIKPDVVVSDIGMALRDGYQFIRLVRTMAPADGGRIPALALTAFSQSEDRVRALLAGYQDHIAKPVDASQLIDAVHRLVPLAP